MKKISLTTLILLAFLASPAEINTNPKTPLLSTDKISFTENKGQVSDQNNNLRSDVLFSGVFKDLTFHLRSDGISYQLQKIHGWKKRKSQEEIASSRSHEQLLPTGYSIYRVDIHWLNTQKASIFTEGEKAGYTNYYNSISPNGIVGVKSFSGVLYKNIYPNIDLHYYEKNEGLKYDYLVSANTDYKQIKLEIKGAKKLSIQKDGSLLVETPFGNIEEGKPIVFQGEQQLEAYWQLENNILSFQIKGVNPQLPLIIDPAIRTWATFYGTGNPDTSTGCAADSSGNVLLSGYTSSSGGPLATSGAHQTTHGGGWTNAFLAKFDVNGVRLWATYYGGNTGYTNGDFCNFDLAGNVYLGGGTTCPNAISTAGSHQQTYTGSPDYDAYLVKFNNSGVRQWATYYGGGLRDEANYCSIDATGNVFLIGDTDSPSTSAIATAGAHQTTFGGSYADVFLVKFNSSGVRQWGTYYGGNGEDIAYFNAVDNAGNVIFTGRTNSSTGTVIASPGSYQSSYGGGAIDAMLVKFDTNGQRIYGTYFGGPSNDAARGCALDNAGNIFMAGYSSFSSSAAIASPGAFQTNGLGSGDAFLAKFSSGGNRLWGTFFSTPDGEDFTGCVADKYGNVYCTGYNTSLTSSIVATPGSFQQSNNGGINGDMTLQKFNSSGQHIWGTYFGGNGSDYGYCVATDGLGHVYLTGFSTSTTSSMGSTNGYQPSNSGGNGEGVLAQFFDCDFPAAPVNLTSPASLKLCDGGSTQLLAGSTGTIAWYSSPTSTTAITSGSTLSTGTLSPGTYSYYASALSCALSPTLAMFQVTVNPLPTVIANITKSVICTGDPVTLNGSGANTYTWSAGKINGQSFVPTATSSYSVSGTNTTSGCTSTNIAVVSVTVNNLPTLTVTSSNSLICDGVSVTLTAIGANSYTWSNSQLISTIIVSPSITTNYSVNGTDLNNCSNTSNYQQQVINCTSLKEENKLPLSSLNVFPNPNKGHFTLLSTEEQNLKLINDLGQMIRIIRLDISNNYSYEICDLPKGIYLITNNDTGLSYRQKIVVTE